MVSKDREGPKQAALPPPKHPRNCRHTLVLRIVAGFLHEFLLVLTSEPQPENIAWEPYIPLPIRRMDLAVEDPETC